MHRIVIVGGGIAGMVVATRLGREMAGRSKADILLVDRNSAHVWKPMLHTFAAGTANYTTQAVAFAPHAMRNGFRYWPGVLAGLDRSRKTVLLGSMTLQDGRSELLGRRVRYDTLVVAVGIRANDFGTPGVTEHCHVIDDVGRARAFEAALRSRIVQSLIRDVDPRVAIVGGGAAGVELAAELTRRMDIFSRYDPGSPSPRLRITLVETGPRVLASFPERISREAGATLTRLGVDVMTGTKVTGIDASGMSLEGGGRVDADLMVWAAGVKAPAATAGLDGLATDGIGRILVRPTLQSRDDDDVFVLGDCASFEDGGKPLPATAQVARQQAVFLAKSLRDRFVLGEGTSSFRYRDMGSLVNLGDYAAYGSLGEHGFFRGAVITGRLARAGHAILYRMHQLDLNGVVRGGAGWLADDLLHIARPRINLD